MPNRAESGISSAPTSGARQAGGSRRATSGAGASVAARRGGAGGDGDDDAVIPYDSPPRRAKPTPSPRHYPDAGTILKQMGVGASNSWPVGVSVPRPVSMRRTTTLLVLWLPTIIQAPEGSVLKLRGPLPPDDWWPAGVSRPVRASRVKMAMLS